MLQLCLEQPLVTEMFGRFRQSHGWEHDGNRNGSHLIVIGLDGEAVFRLDEEAVPHTAGGYADRAGRNLLYR